MMKYFKCPDDGREIIETCIQKGGCRMGRRCLTLATLVQLSKQREWRGVPSTTQLIGGTCEAFLKITEEYTSNPTDQMFKLLGTKVHNRLSSDEVDGSTMEDENSIITSHGISMTADLVEDEDGWRILTDYKTSGSFKVAKAMGITAHLVEHPNETYHKRTTITDPESGVIIVREAGQKKFVKTYESRITNQDCDDWVKQLNYYRIGIEEKTKQKIDEMRIEAIVRDGGLVSARNYGVKEKVYLIPIPQVEDQQIVDYFLMKKNALMNALDNGKCESGCTNEECWGGTKCSKYCDVLEFCEYGKIRVHS